MEIYVVVEATENISQKMFKEYKRDINSDTFRLRRLSLKHKFFRVRYYHLEIGNIKHGRKKFKFFSHSNSHSQRRKAISNRWMYFCH